MLYTSLLHIVYTERLHGVYPVCLPSIFWASTPTCAQWLSLSLHYSGSKLRHTASVLQNLVTEALLLNAFSLTRYSRIWINCDSSRLVPCCSSITHKLSRWICLNCYVVLRQQLPYFGISTIGLDVLVNLTQLAHHNQKWIEHDSSRVLHQS